MFLIVTSRPLRTATDLTDYHNMDRADMENEIEQGGFLEYGVYDEHLYGTKLDSVRRVIQSGKMCILDIQPTVSISFFVVNSLVLCF